MTRICHLFDGSAGWEQRVAVSQLVDRLPRGGYANVLASIDSRARSALKGVDGHMGVLPRYGPFAALSAPSVYRFVSRHGLDLIHAWGIRAAAAARGAHQLPLVVQLFDPLAAALEVKRLRAIARPEKFAVLCTSGIVRRRLIEGGLPGELAVLIRPGVDFALINRCRRQPLREQLGVDSGDLLVIVPEPATRYGGQIEAVYAVTLEHHLSGGMRILVPGASPEQRRIARFTAALPLSVPMITTGDRYPFERLVAASDVLLVTPRGDVSTTSVAWAMASGTAVIGTAVHSVAEIIANKVNGLLFKQVPGRSMTAAILRRLRDRTSQEKAKEVARGQAYEVFGLRRYVEQTMRLYENLLNGAPPGEGITDPALVT